MFAGSITTNLSSQGTYFTGGSGSIRQLSITSGTNISAHALHTFNIASSNGKYEFDINGATELSLDSSSATFAGDIKSIGTIGVTQSDGDYLAKLYQSSADGFLELFTGQATPISRTKITSYGDSYINPSNGRVGIGTTNPDASTLLHVQGVIGTTNGFSGCANTLFLWRS